VLDTQPPHGARRTTSTADFQTRGRIIRQGPPAPLKSPSKPARSAPFPFIPRDFGRNLPCGSV
jgi:hypothetical protein